MKIEHIALYVNDLQKTRSFFMKYLGAKSNEGYHNLQTNFRSYFLSFDDGTRLEIMNKPEMLDSPKELARTGYAHIAFSVGSKEKVDALTIELKTDGYEVISGPGQPEMVTMKAVLLQSKAIKLRLQFEPVNFKFTKMTTDRKRDIFYNKDINISPLISINLWN